VSAISAKSRLGPALFASLMISLLIGLGIWQLQRLAWKEGLIEKIEARVKAPAVALPDPALWPRLLPDEYEYRHVELIGRYLPEAPILVFRGTGGGTGIKTPGYLVFSPFKLTSNAYIMINRGFVPIELLPQILKDQRNAQEDVHVLGLMRSPEPRNFFTPPDDPETAKYFTRDPGSMAAHLKLESLSAPFSIDADKDPGLDAWPKGGTTEISIPNNHLGYALTWFGLALGGAGVFIAYLWRG
jgi:surfeit locus 1 family protein